MDPWAMALLPTVRHTPEGQTDGTALHTGVPCRKCLCACESMLTVQDRTGQYIQLVSAVPFADPLKGWEGGPVVYMTFNQSNACMPVESLQCKVKQTNQASPLL